MGKIKNKLLVKFHLLGEKFLESWLACGLAMAQGDLASITFEHAVVAAKVGILTGIAFIIASYITNIKNDWQNVITTGALTTIADALVHPGMWMIGPMWIESIATGIVAMFLAVVYIKIKKRRRNYEQYKY